MCATAIPLSRWAVALTLGTLIGGTTTVSGDAAQALSQLHFSRQQERAADQAALAALRLTYGHLGDAEAFFQKMLCDGGGADLTPEFLHTHPDTQARVDAIVAAKRADTPAAQAAHAPVPLPVFMHDKDQIQSGREKKPERCALRSRAGTDFADGRIALAGWPHTAAFLRFQPIARPSDESALCTG